MQYNAPYEGTPEVMKRAAMDYQHFGRRNLHFMLRGKKSSIKKFIAKKMLKSIQKESEVKQLQYLVSSKEKHSRF